MLVKQVEFTAIEQNILKTHKSALDLLASDIGKAYLVSITRDGCSDCAKQKPKIDRLAQNFAEKHVDKVGFVRVHVKFSPKDNRESLRSKDVFRHYFYPTTLILIRAKDRGAFEYYRSVASRVGELRKNIERAVKTASLLEKA
jgi:thiol-disulfide isomerase/thioredoxin